MTVCITSIISNYVLNYRFLDVKLRRNIIFFLVSNQRKDLHFFITTVYILVLAWFPQKAEPEARESVTPSLWNTRMLPQEQKRGEKVNVAQNVRASKRICFHPDHHVGIKHKFSVS